MNPNRRRQRTLHAIRPIALTLVVFAGCGGIIADRVDTTKEAVGGSITISGFVSDANGLPLSGVTIHLDGSSQSVQSDSMGSYAFTQLAAGSYSVRPTFNSCSFAPDVVNLNNLTASTTQSFAGFGTGCGGPLNVSTGATSGPLTISGHLRDASGAGVVGGRVDLNGGTQATRFTDLTGGYSFHVQPGSYEVVPSGLCPFTPVNVNLNNVTQNSTQDFTTTTNACLTAANWHLDPTGALFTLNQGGAALGGVAAHIESWPNPSSAVSRLAAITAEQPVTARNLIIAGSPAIERQVTLPFDGLDANLAGPNAPIPPTNLLWLTGAVAVGSSVVRFESQLPTNAAASTITALFAADRAFTVGELPSFTTVGPATVPKAPPVPAAGPSSNVTVSTPARISPPHLPGEVSIAATEANVAVYATNGQDGTNYIFVSNDLGNTFTVPPLINLSPRTPLRGDPGAAVGAPNPSGQQNLYVTELTTEGSFTQGSQSGDLFAVIPFQGAPDGSSFTRVNTPKDCTVPVANCQVPDVPQLAADRVTRTVNGDQLYMVWNEIDRSGSLAHLVVSCSTDSGTSWVPLFGNMTAITTSGATDARIAVGPDGSVFVLYSTPDSTGKQLTLYVQKFTSCADGMTAVPGFPVRLTPGTIADVGAIPGLDRPAGANYMIAPDAHDPTGQRIFAVFVQPNSVSATGDTGNDDVRIAESTNGGLSWTIAPFTLNTVSKGIRYFPWICSDKGGTAFVTWYDRRDAAEPGSAPGANPDLTAYFRSSVTDIGGLAHGDEFNVSGLDDRQCISGFDPSDPRPPGTTRVGVRDAIDETGCVDLPPGPIHGGICESMPCFPPGELCGTLVPCDFRNPSACSSTGGGACTPIAPGGDPKYGDYNGAACANGQVFMAWASATPPVGVTCITEGAACTKNANCCSGHCVGGACAPTTSACNATGTSCGADSDCCTANCQGGQCSPQITLYASAASCTKNPCPTPPVSSARELTVTLSSVSFTTTGFNLFNCTTPAQTPRPEGIRGLNANGDVVITCTPQQNADGSLSTTPVTVKDEVSCSSSSDNNDGALVVVTCSGTGVPGDIAINATVSLSIESSCGSNQANGGNEQTYTFDNLVPGQPQVDGGPFKASCDSGSNGCFTGGACQFNDFQAVATVTNTSM